MIALVEPKTGGDPEGVFHYTRSSLRSLSIRLGRGSATTVGKLLKPLGYSLKTNVKRLIGKPFIHRDKQYRFIQRVKALFIAYGESVISVDAKKTALIGHFKNSGKRYCRHADEVNTYDFPSEAECKATPFGIYDPVNNHGLVMVGTSATTAQFAVASIRSRWTCFGSIKYPDAQHLLIEAESGAVMGIVLGSGSKNYKNGLMKVGLPLPFVTTPLVHRNGIRLNTVYSARLVVTGRAHLFVDYRLCLRFYEEQQQIKG